jgi:hypothetical protein
MSQLKELKYFTLTLLLCSFVAAGSLSSCRDEKKKESTEQGEHPESEEHPTEESTKEEHPTEGGDEHPTEGGEEHPTDSISG